MRRLLSVLAFGGLLAFPVLPTNVAFAADTDGDSVDDAVDVCPAVADPFQGDIDSNGVGDLCEPGTSGVTNFEGTPEGELVFGTAEADTLSGAGGDDALYGLGGDDTLNGGDGRDFLSGGAGADTLTGGPGCDVFAFDPSGDNDVITDFDIETDRMTFPAAAGESTDSTPTPTFGGEEDLVVTFVANNEQTATLEFQGLPAGIEIALDVRPCAAPPEVPDEVIPPEEPGPGPDPGPGPVPDPPFVCAPLFPFVIDADLFDIVLPLDGKQVNGTAANETLTGTDCSDVIAGDAQLNVGDSQDETPPPAEPPCAEGVCSDDVINGLGGNDLLVGDKTVLDYGETGGNDTINGGAGDDLVVGDAAFIGDCGCGGTTAGDVAPDVSPAIGGNDKLFGGEGDDVMFGDAVETLSGAAIGGDDQISGDDGDDIIVGDAIIIEGGAVGGSDLLMGGAGDDIIYGDAAFGIDEFSSGGDDSLTGGAGNDILYGDAPIVDGDAGSDTFWYDTNSNFGDDTIVDLGEREVTDYIVFTAFGSGLSTVSELDDRSTVGDDSPSDLLATVFTDNTKATKIGSILIAGAGGLGITSWADLEAMWTVDVVVIP